MHARIRPEPGGLLDLKQVARQMLARAREDTKAFETSAEHEHDIIARLDASERILYINLTGERVYGSPRSSFVGKAVQELGLPRETTRRIREGLQHVFATGETVEPHIELPVKGETLHFRTIIAPEGREAGRPTSVLLLARDVTEKRRAEEARRQLEAEKKARAAAEEAMRRSLLLAEVTALLDSCRDPMEAMPRLAELLVARVADLCVIDTVDEGGSMKRAAVAHSLASKAPLARELMTRFPPRIHLGPSTPEVLASRTPRLYSPSTDAHLAAAAYSDEHLRVLRGLGPRSSVVIPLYSHGHAIGTLGLAITESDRQYTLDDMAFMVELGRQIAIAVENALLQRKAEEAQVAAERAARFAKRLLEATLAISEAATASEIALRAIERIGLSLKATSASIAMLSSDARSLEVLEAKRFGGSARPKSAPIPLDAPLPLAHAVSRGELLRLSFAELPARFPSAERDAREAGALVCVPLHVDSRTIGGLEVTFAEAEHQGSNDLDFLQLVSRTAAQALERARALEAEKRSREKAERSARAMARHHQITDELTRAVTREDVAAILARELGSALSADGCAVGEIEADSLRLVTLTGAELAAFGSRARLPLTDMDPLSHAARQGEAVWPPARAASEPHTDGGSTRWAVPLLGSAGPIGAISLSFKRERPIDADDRAFVETAARIGAHALERTRLYHAIENAESKVAAIVRTAPLAIMVFDFDGTVRSWNPAAEAIFGWSAEEACGRFMPAVPDERRAEFLGYLDALARGEVIAGREMLRRRKGGALLPVVVWWSKLNNPDGSAQCMAIAKDITTLRLGELAGELHAEQDAPAVRPKSSRAAK